MNELIIQTHDFENAKNQIKEFAENTPDELQLCKFPTTDGIFEIFDHKVTGAELNNFVAKLQEIIIALKARENDFTKEFGQVYTAFESLDKDYIQGILVAVKSAESASQEAKTAQEDLKVVIDRLEKTVESLDKFKAEIKAYAHLKDIDYLWNSMEKIESMLADISHKIDPTDKPEVVNQEEIDCITDRLNKVQFENDGLSRMIKFSYFIS